MSLDMKNVCRICTESGHLLFSLFESKNEFNLVEMIDLISQVKVEENDELPHSICNHCFKELDMTRTLIKKCKDSDEYLKQNLKHIDQREKSTTDSIQSENLLNIVIEDVELEEEHEDLESESSDQESQVQFLDIDDIIEEEILEPDEVPSEPMQENYILNEVDGNSISCVDDLIIVDPTAQVAASQEANYTQCCGCVQNFNTYEELLDHSKQFHITEKAICGPMPDNLMECTICYKMFSGVSYLDSMHRLNAFKNRLVSIGFPDILQCCSCDELFSTKGELLEHSQQHIDEKMDDDPSKPFECQFCYKRYSKKQTLNFHQKFSSSYKKRQVTKRRGCRAMKKRSDIEGTTENRKCCGCSAEFPSVDSLRQHSQMHHELYRRQVDPTNSFECEICFKQFPTSIRLEQHRLVPYIRKHECSECKKTFLSQALLRKHIKHHSLNHVDAPKPAQPLNEQTFQCDECGKILNNKYQLQSHKKSKHSLEKSFSCSLCSRQFKWKHTLQSHLRVHTKEQPYSCSYCWRTFTQLTDKNRHESTHSKQFPLKCATCDKGFPAGRKKELEKHKKLHQAGEEYPLTCQFCDRTFTRLAQRNRHQARHVAERDRNIKMKMEEIGIV